MENGTNSILGTDGLWGVIIFLIIAGIIGGNGFFGNSNASRDITNEFMYNQLANQNTNTQNLVGTVDRDVLENRYTLDKEIMQNRYDMSLQTNQLQNQANVNALNAQAQMSSCCCDLKTTIHNEGEATRALITQNRISNLEKELNLAQIVASNQTQTQNILSTIGQWYSKPAVNPYYAYSYNGTTLG